MIKEITVGSRIIGAGRKPFIIAEMSGNHNQSLEKALQIIDAAAETGVDAIKIQTYTADTMTIDHDEGLFKISDKNSLWDGYNLYELYKIAHTPWEWHKALFDRAKERGVMLFSTPFDRTAVDFLEDLGNPIYKIASFENTHQPLLKRIAQTGKPVIMSTGMASMGDIEESLKVLRENGCKDIILLQCTSSYPASPKNSNIKSIPVMKEVFDCQIGLSDHTLGIGVPIASIALGATVVEKHFVLDRAEGGVDAAFSLEPNEFSLLVEECTRAHEALGKVSFGVSNSEKSSVRFRRSIYVIKDLKKGEIFSENNIRIIRPGDGLAPKYLKNVLGKKVNKNLKRGTPLSWESLL
jgi:pseudaminic acid synthase